MVETKDPTQELVQAAKDAVTYQHPGDVLLKKYLEPRGITPTQLALDLHVPASRITAITSGERAITAETAYRLALCLGTTPEYWLGLQAHYNLWQLKPEQMADIERQVRPTISNEVKKMKKLTPDQASYQRQIKRAEDLTKRIKYFEQIRDSSRVEDHHHAMAEERIAVCQQELTSVNREIFTITSKP